MGRLLDRHNRIFSLTPAGEHFYRKSLVISGDLQQLIRETRKIATNNNAILKIGYYKGYHGNELSEAIASFSEKYPTVDVEIMVGSHDELYQSMENGSIDLSLNDQRRAFSNAYNNEVLAESHLYAELSAKNPIVHSGEKITPAIILRILQKCCRQGFKDLMAFGMFIFALLTFVFTFNS